VPRYCVCFEGKWQEVFDDLEDALAWGREVSDTGRLVHVARRGLFWTKLVAIFPESQAEEGKWLWKARMKGSGSGG
jgi:hypothetical protein